MSTNQPISVIGLNGSPNRTGNTATLMQWVLEGCAEAGAEVAWMHIVDYDVRYCRGCFTCLRTGACPIQDDFADLLATLQAADGIVAGSPVYEGYVTAQFKTLLDRITLLHLYTNRFDAQYTVGVATSGVAPTRGVAKELATFFGHRVGMIGAKTSTIAHGYQPLADVHPDRLPQRAHRLGQRLVRRIQQPGVRIPSPQALWIKLLQRFVIRPLVLGNEEQFAGVIKIWREKGILTARE